MLPAEKLVRRIEKQGGKLELISGRVRFQLPKKLECMIGPLRALKPEIVEYLSSRRKWQERCAEVLEPLEKEQERLEDEFNAIDADQEKLKDILPAWSRTLLRQSDELFVSGNIELGEEKLAQSENCERAQLDMLLRQAEVSTRIEEIVKEKTRLFRSVVDGLEG